MTRGGASGHDERRRRGPRRGGEGRRAVTRGRAPGHDEEEGRRAMTTVGRRAMTRRGTPGRDERKGAGP